MICIVTCIVTTTYCQERDDELVVSRAKKCSTFQTIQRMQQRQMYIFVCFIGNKGISKKEGLVTLCRGPWEETGRHGNFNEEGVNCIYLSASGAIHRLIVAAFVR